MAYGYDPQDQYYNEGMEQDDALAAVKDESVVLKNTPWWAISMVAHAAVMLLLTQIVMAGATLPDAAKLGQVVTPPPWEQPPPIERDVVIEEPIDALDVVDPVDDVQLVDDAVDDHNEDPTDQDNRDLRPNNDSDALVDSPYEANNSNDAIGIGPNMGGGGGPDGGGGMDYRRAKGPRGGKDHPGDENVISALYWLADHQTRQGSWSADDFMEAGRANGRDNGEYGNPDGSVDTGWGHSSVGVTGLALLAFLGAGYTHRDDIFADTVKRALRYLKNVQENDGCFGSKDDHHYVYNHAICTMAMAEAFAMTGSAFLRPPAQKAVEFIALAQNEDPDQGWLGWRYGIKPGDNDASVTGWMALALKSAKAGELDIPPHCWEGAKRQLDQLTADQAGYPHTGYRLPGGTNGRLASRRSFALNGSMDAINILTRLFMEEPRTTPLLQQQARQLQEVLPTIEDPNQVDYYYWYYASLAMFQMGDAHWDAWEDAMIGALSGSQVLDGDRSYARHGSWDAVDAWSPAGGRVYATAINCLTLEVYYRYEFLGANR